MNNEIFIFAIISTCIWCIICYTIVYFFSTQGKTNTNPLGPVKTKKGPDKSTITPGSATNDTLGSATNDLYVQGTPPPGPNKKTSSSGNPQPKTAKTPGPNKAVIPSTIEKSAVPLPVAPVSKSTSTPGSIAVLAHTVTGSEFTLPAGGVPCGAISGKIPTNASQYSLVSDIVSLFPSNSNRNMIITRRINVDNVHVFVFTTLVDGSGIQVPETRPNAPKLTREYMTQPDPQDPNKGKKSLLDRFTEGVSQFSNGKMGISGYDTVQVSVPIAGPRYNLADITKDLMGFMVAVNNNAQVQGAIASLPKGKNPPLVHIFLPTYYEILKWAGMGMSSCNQPGQRECITILHSDMPNNYLHELGHQNGLMHSGGYGLQDDKKTIAFKEYADESCAMGNAAIVYGYSAATSYIAGFLNKVDYVDLTSFQRNKRYELAVPFDQTHGVILYLPVVLASVSSKKYSQVVPMPFCVLSYRQLTNPYNRSKVKYRRVYVHEYNYRDPWVENPGPKERKDMVTPYVTLLGKLDTLENRTGVYFDASLSDKLPYVITSTLLAQDQRTWNNELSNLAKALGFPETNRRPAVPSFNVTVVSTDADRAQIIITTY